MDKKTAIDVLRYSLGTSLHIFGVATAAYTGVYFASKVLGPIDINLNGSKEK